MITREQLEVYARFDGDVDGLTRAGTEAERALVAGGVWSRVDRLRDGLARVRAGVAAPEYAARVEAEVAREFPDPAAREILARMVDTDAQKREPAG